MRKHYFLGLSFAFIASISFGQWLTINPTNSIRSSHVSAKLTDGTILVAGGFGETTQIKTAEYLEPSTGIWYNTTTEMSEYHSSGTATLLPDLISDKVLVTGGWTGSVNTTSCELYDKMSNSWSNASSMLNGRSDHTATLLLSGKVLVIGGYDGINNLASCELYDPATDTWSIAGSLNLGRSSHTATLLNDGRVLITGGYNPNAGFQLSSTEIYNPSNDTWVNGPDMVIVRNQHAASILSNGKVLITGGELYTGAVPYAYEGSTSAEVFDPSNNTLSSVQNLPSGLSFHEQVSFGNYVMVVAGKEQTDYLNGNFTSINGKTYLYNVTSDSWQEKAMNLEGRIYFTAHLTIDNKVIVIGGQTDEVEVYDFTAGLTETSDLNANSLYPNPCSSNLTLKRTKTTNNESYQLKDITGRPIEIKTSVLDNQVNFDLSNLPSGSYIIEILSSSHINCLKFIKE